MSFAEAKEQVAKSDGYKSYEEAVHLLWQCGRELRLINMIERAAILWQAESCKETWERACEAQKNVIGQHLSSTSPYPAEIIYRAIINAPKPEYKP